MREDLQVAILSERGASAPTIGIERRISKSPSIIASIRPPAYGHHRLGIGLPAGVGHALLINQNLGCSTTPSLCVGTQEG